MAVTVRELREQLAFLPDDVEVRIVTSGGPHNQYQHEVRAIVPGGHAADDSPGPGVGFEDWNGNIVEPEQVVFLAPGEAIGWAPIGAWGR